MPLHAAFHVPLPSGSAFTFDISIASGGQPVWPALTIFNLPVIMGLFASDAQPAMVIDRVIKALIINIFLMLDLVTCSQG